MDKSPRHIHIVGICGVATSALAIAFQKKGWKVTGSDKGFFPPVSTELEKHQISFYAGWHPENMGMPNVVVVGTASGSQNPETTFARAHGIQIYSFAEAIGKFFVKEYSIVATGTWGKTSSAALLSFILEKAGFDPTYMFGGVSLSHDASASLTDSKYSIFEGDEYKSSPIDDTPKFVYYKPTHILLSAISWDHADLYPTEKSYFDAFKKLIARIPSSGLVVACKDNKKVRELVRDAVWYGKADAEYLYSDVGQSKDGINFKINGTEILSPMIGAFQAENITGCFAMAHKLGVTPEKIVKAIAEFKGLKRRLEKRLDEKIIIFDDIAHSPEKAASVLENLRSIYTGKIIAIFEPNIGGRSRESASKYDRAFKNADMVFIPRLTKLKTSDKEVPMEGDELAATITKTQPNTKYIEDDVELVKALVSETKNQGDVIVFLGSHGFRGMIEKTIESIKRPEVML